MTHEERSNSGIVLAIIIGLLLCLLLVGGAGVGGLLYMRQRAKQVEYEAALALERAVALEHQAALLEQNAQLQMAAAATGQPIVEISVGVDVTGGYTVEGETLTGEELQQYLADQVAANPERVKVLIRPADETAYALVAATTALCEKAGVKNITFLKAEGKDE